MAVLDSKTHQYLVDHSKDVAPILQELRRKTHLQMLMPQMISGDVQGNFLTMFCKMINAKYVLEVGTFTGYGTICLANGILNDGQVITLEKNKEYIDIANEYFVKAGVDHKITQLIGDAVDLVAMQDYTWDLVFIDGAKKSYSEIFDLVFDKVRPGGLILADNVLWSGKVVENSQDKLTKKLDEFNKKIKADQRVDSLIIPLRDGMHIIRKK